MASRLKWRGEQVKQSVRRLIASRLEDAAEYAAAQVRQNIGVQGPPASLPGEYPRRASGELQAGIRAVATSDVRAMVVADADHAPYVEAMRPFLARTIDEIRPSLRRIMLGGSP